MNKLICFLMLLAFPADCDQDCDQKDHNKYDEKSNLRPSWTQYLADHRRASQSYHPKEQPYNFVIENDLKPFLSGITDKMLDQSRQADTHAVTYVALQGVLYRSKNCLFPARCQGVEYFLLKVLDKVPDFELVLNTHDWPQINRHFKADPLPTFSFSKTDGYFDIFFPAWTFWAGGPAISHYPTGIGRWDLMRDKLKIEAENFPWDKKQNVAFFRGSRTSSERDNLVKLSRDHPDLVDAKFTKNQAWKSKADTLGSEPAEEVKLEDHCRYKYLFNFRGVAASFRFKHLMLCQSTVLHVGSDWKEFFYDAMTPWVHYVPITDAQNNQKDIKDVLEFLKSYPEIARSVAQNGHDFIDRHLRMQDIEHYWIKLLNDYARLLQFVPQRNPDHIKIQK